MEYRAKKDYSIVMEYQDKQTFKEYLDKQTHMEYQFFSWLEGLHPATARYTSI